MAEANKNYKVTIKPLDNSSTSSTLFSYAAGRDKYTYGTVNLDDYVTQQLASDYATSTDLSNLKTEIEGEITSGIEGIVVEQGADNTHVTVSKNGGTFTINESDIASAATLDEVKEAVEDIGEITAADVDALWEQLMV